MTSGIDPAGEDRVTAAFDDLKARVAAGFPPGAVATAADDRNRIPMSTPDRPARRPDPRRRGLGVGLAAAAAAVVVLGTAGLWARDGADGNQSVTAGPGSTTSSPLPEDQASVTSGSPETTATGQDPTDGPAPAGGGRYRVDATAVAADRADPFLNLRQGPGPDEPLVAKLPPAYRGLRATGASADTDDGATWVEVELVDPVALAPGYEPPGQGSPTGWVNRAFLVALPDGIAVGTDEVPACAAGASTGAQPDSTGDGNGTVIGDTHLAGVESRLLTPTCLRIVVSFEPGQAPYFWSDVAAGAGAGTGDLPPVRESGSGASGVTVGLGVSSVWPGATGTGDGVYVARAADGTLDLLMPAPATVASITGLPGEARAVIDLDLTGDPAPPAGDGIALTMGPVVSGPSIDVTGVARPFEASLAVSVEDSRGQPVEAVFAGSDFLGTVRTDSYGVSTTDWTEAWGRFAVRVTGLAPGRYTLVLNGDGGSDDPEVLAVPFTIDGSGPGPALAPADDQAAALGLIALARGGPIEGVPLADTVTIGLAIADRRDVARTDLADRSAWVLGVDEYAGYVGPFDLLAPLASGGVQITAGPADHCAAPPLEWPGEWDGLRHVVIEPIGIDSCLQWYAVNLFLDDAGRVRVVMLELWEP